MGNTHSGRVIDPKKLSRWDSIGSTGRSELFQTTFDQKTIVVEKFPRSRIDSSALKRAKLDPLSPFSEITKQHPNLFVHTVDLFVMDSHFCLAHTESWLSWKPFLETLASPSESINAKLKLLSSLVDFLIQLANISQLGFALPNPDYLFIDQEGCIRATHFGVQHPIHPEPTKDEWLPTSHNTNASAAGYVYFVGRVLVKAFGSSQIKPIDQLIASCANNESRLTLRQLSMAFQWLSLLPTLINMADLSIFLLGPIRTPHCLPPAKSPDGAIKVTDSTTNEIAALESLSLDSENSIEPDSIVAAGLVYSVTLVEAFLFIHSLSPYVRAHYMNKHPRITAEEFVSVKHQETWPSIPMIRETDAQLLHICAGSLQKQSIALQFASLFFNRLKMSHSDYVLQLKELHKNGCKDATLQLAICAVFGIGMPQSNSDALEYFTQYASLPNTNAGHITASDLSQSAQDATKEGCLQFQKGNYIRAQCLFLYARARDPTFLPSLIAFRQLGLEHSQVIPLPSDTDIIDQLLTRIQATNEAELEKAYEWISGNSKENAILFYLTGYCLYRGWGVAKNFEKAIPFFEEGSREGITCSQNNLAYCYFEGEGVTKCTTTSTEWWLISALLNHASGQDNIGHSFKNTLEVKDKYQHAAYWFAQSAIQRYANGWNNLGLIHENALGTERHLGKAFRSYEAAAFLGYSWGQNNLGICYYNGDGVEKSPSLAYKWHMKSALQNNYDAYVNVGLCHYHGMGVEVSYEKALDWYHRASEQKNASAQTNIGHCYYSGAGVVQNYETAIEWYRKAAENKSEAAMDQLGYCYEKGLGVPQDDALAFEWYEKASNEEYQSGMWHLALMYSAGKGHAKDNKKAFDLFHRLARSGYTDAYRSLALCYENGEGVDASMEKAVEWYRKGANENHSLSQISLGFCYLEGKGVESELDEAARWFRRSAELGDATGQCLMGLFYKEGYAVEKNMRTALEYYFLSLEQGNSTAEEHLKELREIL